MHAATSSNIPNSIISSGKTKRNNFGGHPLRLFYLENGDRSTNSIVSENRDMERLGVVTVSNSVRGVFLKNESHNAAAASSGGTAKLAASTGE